MGSKNRIRQADRKESAQREFWEREHRLTKLRIQRLMNEHQEALAVAEDKKRAHDQMMGRLRIVEEQLGIAPPMTDMEIIEQETPTDGAEDEESDAENDSD